MWKFIICVVFVLELSVLPDVTLAQSSGAAAGSPGATPSGVVTGSGAPAPAGCHQCLKPKDGEAKCDPATTCEKPESALGKKWVDGLKDLVAKVAAVAEAVPAGSNTCGKITFNGNTYTGCLKDPAATCAEVVKQPGVLCVACIGEDCNLQPPGTTAAAAQSAASTEAPPAAVSSETAAPEVSETQAVTELSTEAANTSNATNATKESTSGSVNYYGNLWIYQLMVVATIKLLFL